MPEILNIKIKENGGDSMNKKSPNIPLEILLLNDLLRVNAIDKDIHDKAEQEILSAKKENLPEENKPLDIPEKREILDAVLTDAKAVRNPGSKKRYSVLYACTDEEVDTLFDLLMPKNEQARLIAASCLYGYGGSAGKAVKKVFEPGFWTSDIIMRPFIDYVCTREMTVPTTHLQDMEACISALDHIKDILQKAAHSLLNDHTLSWMYHSQLAEAVHAEKYAEDLKNSKESEPIRNNICWDIIHMIRLNWMFLASDEMALQLVGRIAESSAWDFPDTRHELLDLLKNITK